MSLEREGEDRQQERGCCSIASCIGYFELFCALQFTYCAVPTLLCYSVYRSTAQRTVYLHRQELSVIVDFVVSCGATLFTSILFCFYMLHLVIHSICFYFTSIRLVRIS